MKRKGIKSQRNKSNKGENENEITLVLRCRISDKFRQWLLEHSSGIHRTGTWHHDLFLFLSWHDFTLDPFMKLSLFRIEGVVC
jgi:hypothetical protein